MSLNINGNTPIISPGLHRFGEINSDGKISTDESELQTKGMYGLDWDVWINNRDAFQVMANPFKPKIELQLMDDRYDKSPDRYVEWNGIGINLTDPEYAKYLDDKVQIGDNGLVTRKIDGSDGIFGASFQILGTAIGEYNYYTPPKYTDDFFNWSAESIFSADSITRAEKELRAYSLIGLDELPHNSWVGRNSETLAKDMLNFLTKGTASQTDIDKTKASIENVIKELVEMFRNGEEPDLNKVKGKVDVMGEQVTITQVLDMQKYGKELTNQLIGAGKEGMSLNSERIGEFAKRGIIKSMGMSYGDQIGGVLGEMFKSAWGAEVDRHSKIKMNELDSSAGFTKDEQYNSFVKTLNNGAEWMYDVFSKIDTSSKENALKSFKDLSGEIDKAIRKFLDQYTGTGGLDAKMRNEVNSYFYDLLGFRSVDVKA